MGLNSGLKSLLFTMFSSLFKCVEAKTLGIIDGKMNNFILPYSPFYIGFVPFSASQSGKFVVFVTQYKQATEKKSTTPGRVPTDTNDII